MTSLLRPAQFNEQFTISLNGAGQPVQRNLADMNGHEVATAIDWNMAESQRLEEEAKRFTLLAETLERTGELPADTSPDMVNQAVSTLRQAADAQSKCAALMELVRSKCPPRYADRPYKDIARWWPGGGSGSGYC